MTDYSGHDNEYVMKTRSGLTIKTVPSVRRSSSKTNFRTSTSQQSNIAPDDPKFSRVSQNSQTSHKSMSYLSFVTRYNLLIKGTKLEVSDCHKVEDFNSLENENGCAQQENSDMNFRMPLNELESSRQDDCQVLEEITSELSHPKQHSDEKTDPRNSDVSPGPLWIQAHNITKSCNKTEVGCSMKISPEEPDTVQTDAKMLIRKCFNPVLPEIKFSIKRQEERISFDNQPVQSTSKVKPHLSESFKLGEQHLVQAQTLNGRPLLYNNIPVMVVNRIPPPGGFKPLELPFSKSPQKLTRKQVDTGFHNRLQESGCSSNTTFSPKRKPDSNKETNVGDTDEDDSSDTCSQGSQDSNISDFDLGIFQMESHAFAQDANGNQIHKCKICDRVFTVFSAFKTHVNSHVKVKNRCHICGKIFSRSWLLKGHMRTHTGA